MERERVREKDRGRSRKKQKIKSESFYLRLMAIRRNACRSMIVLVDITDFYFNTSQRNTYLALSLPLSLSLTEIFLWLCCHESKILGAKQDRILSTFTHVHQYLMKKFLTQLTTINIFLKKLRLRKHVERRTFSSPPIIQFDNVPSSSSSSSYIE